MTPVEADKIIDRLINGCVWNRFDEPGVQSEYHKALLRHNYGLMDKAVDSALEEDSKNVPPISALVKTYKRLSEDAAALPAKNETYCEVCDNKGFVLMTEVRKNGNKDLLYQFILHCPFCAVGMSRAYDGRQGKVKSEYIIPPLTQYFDNEAIAVMRRENRCKREQQQSGKVDIVNLPIGNEMPQVKAWEVSDADDSEFYERGE
jgi:hypothetical protein